MASYRRIALGLLICLAALLPAEAAWAAPAVTNTNDSGPGSLREAVAAAAPGEAISVPAGTYTLTTAQLEIAKSLQLVGAGAGSTIIRAGGAFRVILVKGPGDVTLKGLTVRDGRLETSIAQGAGIWVENANLTLEGVTVADNLAKGTITEGGGLGVRSPNAAITVRDSLFEGNVADSSATEPAKSGGIAEGGGLYSRESGPLTVERTTFIGNRAEARGGQGPSSPVQGGGISQGGGLYVESLGDTAPVLLASTATGNVADSTPGPGSSSGSGSGGGMYVHVYKGEARLTELTIAGNSARGGTSARGGGLYAAVNNEGKVGILSATLAGNSSTALSGAGGADLEWNEGVTIANSVLADAGSCDPEGAGKSLGFNLESGDTCDFHAGGDRVNVDPKLEPLANNGGPTATMLPAPGSPLIDQGASLGLSSDQRGVPRPIDFPAIATPPGGDGSDIGATELQPSNAIALGKLTRNPKRGTALIAISVPLPAAGTLTLWGKGLKARTKAVTGATATMKLALATKGGVKRALWRRGKRKISIHVSYAPLDQTPLTLSRKLKLTHKPPAHHKRPHTHHPH